MEIHLQHRDRVGVADAVLLEDYRSETAFVDNLEKRFNENLIYVSNHLSCQVSQLLTILHFRLTSGQY